MSTLLEIEKKYSKDTIVNKIIGKEIYFACLKDLDGELSKKDYQAVKDEFTANFNIAGTVQAYAKRKSESEKVDVKIQSNPNPTTYICLGTKNKTVQ